MPTINGESLAPRPGVGAGYILGLRTPDASVIMERGMRSRDAAAARAAALRAKEAEQISKDAAENQKINYDAGGVFQEAFNQYAAKLPETLGAVTARVQRGEISRTQAMLEVSKIKGEAERERMLSIDKDKGYMAYQTKALADKYRDQDGVHQVLGAALIGEDKSRVLASKYDEMGATQAADNNPLTYNPTTIFEDYAKSVATNTIDEANAGRIGGTHSSSSLTYKGTIPVKRADGTWDVMRDGTGRPVNSMSADDLATDRASNHNLNMAVARLEIQEKADAEKEGRAPRPAIELFQQGAGKYFSFKQSDSKGLNGLGWRPRAPKAGPAATIAFDERNVAPAEVGAAITEGTPFTDFFNVPQIAPVRNFTSARHAGAPLIPQKNGTNKPVTVSSFYSREAYEEDGSGRMKRVTNNGKQSDVALGDAYQLPVDPKTKAAVFPKNREEEEDYYRRGYTKQTFVAGYVDKNENFNADYQRRLDELTAQNAMKVGDSKKTPSQLEDAARKAASQGVARRIYPYNEETAGTINNATPYYRDFHRNTVKGRGQVAPARSTTAGLYPKAAPAPKPAAKANTPTKKNAGLY